MNARQRSLLLNLNRVLIFALLLGRPLKEYAQSIDRPRPGRRTVAQIFINDEPIGGFDELSQMDLPDKLA